MAESITSNGTPLDTASSGPSIRGFQIDPSGLGSIAESVNLFRGDVNLPINLLTISSKGGIEVTATILYNSNVWKDADAWNMESPTGPLGLGWTMGFDFIALDNKNSIAPNDDQYYLVSGGSVNQLHFISQTADYREYELDSYQFWQIRFYPVNQQWIIIKEDGNRSIFGGLLGNPATEAIQYCIKWGGINGNWTGSSTRTTGQSIFAAAWNLARIENTFGNGIDFYYENEMAVIGSATGLLYTVASRLKKVNSPKSRCLVFVYENKMYDTNIKEYQKPHVLFSSPDLYAYQDRLETKYLDSIELRNAADAVAGPGTLLTNARFTYEIKNIAAGNIHNPDFFKRYLTGISMESGRGLPLPGFSFNYYNSGTEDHAQPGALKNIVYPQGGKVAYSYDYVTLPSTSRALEWIPTGIPKIWYGPDYTIYAEYDKINKLHVKILTWTGTWVEAPQTYTISEKVKTDSLHVSVQNDFFALSFRSDATNPRLFTALFHKEKGRKGHWLAPLSERRAHASTACAGGR